MRPRCWLLRGSWRLEHNQCHSLYPLPSVLLLSNPRKSGSKENILVPRCPIATLALSTRTCEEPSNHDSSGASARVSRLSQEIVGGRFVQYGRHGGDDRD